MREVRDCLECVPGTIQIIIVRRRSQGPFVFAPGRSRGGLVGRGVIMSLCSCPHSLEDFFSILVAEDLHFMDSRQDSLGCSILGCWGICKR